MGLMLEPTRLHLASTLNPTTASSSSTDRPLSGTQGPHAARAVARQFARLLAPATTSRKTHRTSPGPRHTSRKAPGRSRRAPLQPAPQATLPGRQIAADAAPRLEGDRILILILILKLKKLFQRFPNIPLLVANPEILLSACPSHTMILMRAMVQLGQICVGLVPSPRWPPLTSSHPRPSSHSMISTVRSSSPMTL